MRNNAPTHVLWTGGWDSTFRVLSLVIERGVTVEPLYLNDKGRPSSPVEMRSMDDIRGVLERYHRLAASRLLPSRVVDIDSVEDNAAITSMYSRLQIGAQYDWLARYAVSKGLDGLEMCLVKGGPLDCVLRPDLKNVEGTAGQTLRLRQHLSNLDLEMFRPFSFPTLDLTKQDMGRLAKNGGYSDIMRLTWFCHSPKGARPCGHCDPCMIAIKGGMGERIPLMRQMRPRLRFVRNDIRQTLDRFAKR